MPLPSICGHELGFTSDLTEQFRSGYLAIYDGKTYNEQMGYELLQASGALADGTPYAALSAGRDQGSQASIQIDGVEYTEDARGMNVVVYDTQKGLVVSCGHFDTYQQAPTVEFEPLGEDRYAVCVDAHGNEAWLYYTAKIHLWDSTHATKENSYELLPGDDGLYTATVSLAGMDAENLQMAIYLHYYGDLFRCSLREHVVLAE